jgi:hypothetical protein
MNRQTICAGFPALLALLLALQALSGCESPSDPSSGPGEPAVLSGAVNINGSATLGVALTVDTSSLNGTGAVSYQWIRDDSTAIAGAVSETYTPKAADFEKLLKVRVSRAGYEGTVESDSVGPVSGTRDNMNWRLSGTTKYFSLSQGIEIPAEKSNTAEWDIAVKAEGAFCYVLTNSGVTAASLGSGGNGGVWFTTKGTDFSGVALADRVTDLTGANAEYADYVTDVTRSQYAMFVTETGPMNIMTYYGYLTGDGLSEATQFGWSFPGPPGSPFYEFNKKAFAAALGGMPPPWYATGEVYIIRHADGVSYSKLQFPAVRYQRGFTYIVSFKFKNL